MAEKSNKNRWMTFMQKFHLKTTQNAIKMKILSKVLKIASRVHLCGIFLHFGRKKKIEEEEEKRKIKRKKLSYKSGAED